MQQVQALMDALAKLEDFPQPRGEHAEVRNARDGRNVEEAVVKFFLLLQGPACMQCKDGKWFQKTYSKMGDECGVAGGMQIEKQNGSIDQIKVKHIGYRIV